MRESIGKYALCRNKTILTFEHIPPRAAFNYFPAKPVSGDKLFNDPERMPWDIQGLQYTNQQRGMGLNSLCKVYNNTTGAWYGDEYNTIAHAIHSILIHDIPPQNNVIRISEIHPLRFCKQILSMLCSINNNIGDPRFDDLRKFVLDKDKIGIDKSHYRLCMYFTRSITMKYAPPSFLLIPTTQGNESIALSEITAYPLGFILYFDPQNTISYEGIDIISFADFNYGDKVTAEFPLCINDMNDIFPIFFRTKEEIRKCIESNIRGT